MKKQRIPLKESKRQKAKSDAILALIFVIGILITVNIHEWITSIYRWIF